MRQETWILFSLSHRGRRADPFALLRAGSWAGLGRGKPRPYVSDIKGSALG